ncbi:MAG TPA: hypothetical protein VLA00_11100 [Xanthobacteraceae bacterium]|nr:hypothetical protein [Xanthobacteraceae bacterium]
MSTENSAEGKSVGRKPNTLSLTWKRTTEYAKKICITLFLGFITLYFLYQHPNIMEPMHHVEVSSDTDMARRVSLVIGEFLKSISDPHFAGANFDAEFQGVEPVLVVMESEGALAAVIWDLRHFRHPSLREKARMFVEAVAQPLRGCIGLLAGPANAGESGEPSDGELQDKIINIAAGLDVSGLPASLISSETKGQKKSDMEKSYANLCGRFFPAFQYYVQFHFKENQCSDYIYIERFFENLKNVESNLNDIISNERFGSDKIFLNHLEIISRNLERTQIKVQELQSFSCINGESNGRQSTDGANIILDCDKSKDLTKDINASIKSSNEQIHKIRQYRIAYLSISPLEFVTYLILIGLILIAISRRLGGMNIFSTSQAPPQ